MAPMTAPTEFAPGLELRGLSGPMPLSRFKLIAFDMDSTLINIECIDEVADAVGRKAEVAAITEAAMRGEITDFQESLRRRLALLQGATEADLARVARERMRLNPGAGELVSACRQAGLKVLLVSGGFTYFADQVRAQLGIDFVRANVLDIQQGQLTGQLVAQSWGLVCDGEQKRRTVLDVASLLGIGLHECIAMGDGANDLPMMQACAQAGGLSVAYHAKPKVREQARVAITQGGLDRLLQVLQP